jgi:hypothetical protein
MDRITVAAHARVDLSEPEVQIEPELRNVVGNRPFEVIYQKLWRDSRDLRRTSN